MEQLNIAIFEGEFNYDVVNYFSKELYDNFKKIKSVVNKVILIDLKKFSSTEINDIFKKNHINLVLSFNGVNAFGYDYYVDNNIDLGIILVDHPYFHLDRINHYKNCNSFFCMYDERYLDAFEETISDEVPIAWLMHAGIERSHIEKKSNDIIMSCGLKDYRLYEKKIMELPDGILRDISKNVYASASKDYNKPLYDYFKLEFSKKGITENDIKNNFVNKSAICHIYGLVDRCLRSKNRELIMLKILENGYIINHFGNIKNERIENNKNFLSNGPLDYLQLTREISKSNILIHDTPFFSNGSHERVFTSMLNNTTVFSNINNYSNNIYMDKESICYYDINNLDSLIENIDFYLSHEHPRRLIEKKAYELTKKYNTWENRAEEILRIYSIFKKSH